MSKKINVGLIGCGAIGRTLAKAIITGKAGEISLIALCDIDKDKLDSLHKELGREKIIKTPNSFSIIKNPKISLIIEAASKYAVKEIAERTLDEGKNLLIMSAGAFADENLYKILREKAVENNLKIYVPSGAIVGLDGVKSASVEKLLKVEIISTKNPRSLDGAPYLMENNIDISNLKGPKKVFEGNAETAIRGFPKNVNVAIILSLAGLGVNETLVTIIADPNTECTQHEIKAKGDFGELHALTRNNLHPENPKTSFLAPLSAIRILRKISEPIQIGT